jgi:hypothetical protein
MIKKKNFIPNNKKEILDVISNIDWTLHDSVINGYSTYNKVEDYKKYKVFNNIVNEFKKMAGKNYQVSEFWINVYKPGGYVKKHNHETNDPILKKTKRKVGVFYVRKPENSGDININDKWISIKENDMILFDPTFYHYTAINKSDKDRIICSINLTQGLKKVFNKKLNKFKFIKC